MKNQLLLIFAFFFIAALASPFEDVTNDLTKRQLSTCLEGCISPLCTGVLSCGTNAFCVLGDLSTATTCVLGCVV
jgi:hypothetical protein